MMFSDRPPAAHKRPFPLVVRQASSEGKMNFTAGVLPVMASGNSSRPGRVKSPEKLKPGGA
jgi:hypothetical protein